MRERASRWAWRSAVLVWRSVGHRPVMPRPRPGHGASAAKSPAAAPSRPAAAPVRRRPSGTSCGPARPSGASRGSTAVSVEALIRANRLAPNAKLRVGQRLSLPLSRGPGGQPGAAVARRHRAGAAAGDAAACTSCGRCRAPSCPPSGLAAARGTAAWTSGPSGATPIRAAAAGMVITSGWERAYGRVVKIWHPSDLMTVYAHNLENLVKVGRLGRAGPGDRDRRQHRTRDRAPSPLRDPPERPEVQPRVLAARDGGPRGFRQGPRSPAADAMTAGREPSQPGRRRSRAPAAAGRRRPDPPTRPSRTTRTSTTTRRPSSFPPDEELDAEEAESLGSRPPIEIYLERDPPHPAPHARAGDRARQAGGRRGRGGAEADGRVEPPPGGDARPPLPEPRAAAGRSHRRGQPRADPRRREVPLGPRDPVLDVRAPGGSGRPSSGPSPTRPGSSGCRCTWRRCSESTSARASGSPRSAASRRSWPRSPPSSGVTVKDLEALEEASKMPLSLETPVGGEGEGVQLKDVVA